MKPNETACVNMDRRSKYPLFERKGNVYEEKKYEIMEENGNPIGSRHVCITNDRVWQHRITD